MVKLSLDGRSNVVVPIVFLVIDTFAVILRIFAKRKTKHRFGTDDGWIFLALALFFVWSGMVIQACLLNGSIDPKFLYFTHIAPDDATMVFKLIWLAEMFFFLTITAVKLSILDFYRHIFATKKFCIAAHIISVICVLWLLAGILYNIFDCDPIAANYDVRYPTLDHCAPFGIYFFLHELLNSLIDVAILAMPFFVIRRLRLTSQQKVQVIGIFLLGGFVLVTCILRMAYTFSPQHWYVAQSFPGRTLWSTVELGVAIVCACLPVYRPLMPKSFGISNSVKSWYFSIYRVTRSNPGASGADPELEREQSADYINLEAGKREHGL